MTQAVEKIIAQIDALTPDERGELAYAFLSSIEPLPEVTAAWDAEVKRRFEDVLTKKEKGIPASEVFEKHRERASS